MAFQTPSLNVKVSSSKSVLVATSAAAIVAILVISHDADDTFFPEGEMVVVTDYETAIAKAGTGGNLKEILEDFAQISAPNLVVLRVASSDTVPPTDEELVAALNEFDHCQQLFGFKPDYIGAPGLESTLLCNAMRAKGAKLDALPYFVIPAATKADAIVFANSLSGVGAYKPFWPDFVGYTGRATTILLATRAFIDAKDNELYGRHKTTGNVPLSLVSGLTQKVIFDSTGASGDVKFLNEAGITTAVYFDNSWRFWGDEVIGGEGRQQFENVKLVDLWMKKTLQEQELKFASFGLSKSFIKNVKSNIEKTYRSAMAKGWFIGFSVDFLESKNPTADLGSGKWVISARHTVPSPASRGVIEVESTDEFYSTLAKAVAA